jgi:hypothetical protein
MRLWSFLAHRFRMRGAPSASIKAARRCAAGSKVKASMAADRQVGGGEAEERLQRRFEQLVAGGWSFRAAIVVALVEDTVNSAPERHFS